MLAPLSSLDSGLVNLAFSIVQEVRPKSKLQCNLPAFVLPSSTFNTADRDLDSAILKCSQHDFARLIIKDAALVGAPTLAPLSYPSLLYEKLCLICSGRQPFGAVRPDDVR